MALAIRSGLGIGALPNWMAARRRGWCGSAGPQAAESGLFFVYPEELRNSKRVAVFRDFLLARLQQRNN